MKFTPNQILFENFAMYDVKIHHNWVRNTGTEGFYVGNSHGDTYKTFTCNGVSTNVYEHQVFGVQSHHNLIENSGQDGMQYGGAFDVEVHHNVMRNCAINSTLYHQNGIQTEWASL